LADFDRAVELGERGWDIYYAIASAKSNVEDYNGSVKDFDRAISQAKKPRLELYGYRGIARATQVISRKLSLIIIMQ